MLDGVITALDCILNFRMKSMVYAAILVCMKLIQATANKRKMCVEYQVQNSRRHGVILDVIEKVEESECLQRCARIPECMGYNLWREEAKCELVPSLFKCRETGEHNGSKFVQLGSCEGETPWVATRRNHSEDCLIWEHRNADMGVGVCPEGALRAPNDGTCASITTNRGLYLPSWYADGDIFRAIKEPGKVIYCSRSGYVLIERPTCPVTWQSYSAGDPIPTEAVGVCTWKDGTPLYLVAALLSNKHITGYYLPSEKQTFFYRNGIKSPLQVKMLAHGS